MKTGNSAECEWTHETCADINVTRFCFCDFVMLETYQYVNKTFVYVYNSQYQLIACL